jgi:Domain of unknown function (DU1801)
MAENKTKPTAASVVAFLGTVADEQQRGDALLLSAMMERLTGEPPKLWGPSIIGFGRYHYKYESGREGDMCRIGFSPRKGQTVIYLVEDFAGKADLLARLGKHKVGKACLYIKRLTDVDFGVLEEVCGRSLAWMEHHYP